MIADTERTLQKLLQKLRKENAENGLNIICKKNDYMVVSKSKTLRYEILYRDVRYKREGTFKEQGSVLEEVGKR